MNYSIKLCTGDPSNKELFELFDTVYTTTSKGLNYGVVKNLKVLDYQNRSISF